METAATADFAKSSQALADKAGEGVRAGIQGARRSIKEAGEPLNDMADQTREIVAGAMDAVVGYTRRNPLQALAIAAASGALLYAALKAYQSFRD